MRVVRLAGRAEDARLEHCVASLDADAPADYRELAALLALDWLRRRPARVGLSGGQGAGKSTLGSLIVSACDFFGIRACVLGIDDFYLTREARRELARRVHPLFETRGPPGTHDVALCRAVLGRLAEGQATEVPVFDKGLDDRCGSRRLEGPYDLVLLEGWCVGAEPVAEASLELPINALERQEDPDLGWRSHVNQQLAGPYRELWAELDLCVFLAVPDLAAVLRWRGQQDEALAPAQRLAPPALDRFVQHYERVTRSMLETLPARAEVTVRLSQDHSVAGVEFG